MAGDTAFAKTGKLIDVPMVDYLSRYVSDPALVRLLTEFYFSGTPALFGMGYSKIYLDYYYPEGGLQSLTDALGEDIKDHGGAIRTGCTVERIEVSGNRATGVTTSDGSRIEAGFVVAACDMRQVFLKMMLPTSTSGAYRRRIEDAKIGESAVNVFVATDIPPSRLLTVGCPHVFLFPDYLGIDEKDRSTENYFSNSPLEISIPCLVDPSLAPEGKTGIVISACARAILLITGEFGTEGRPLSTWRSQKGFEIRC